MGIVSLGMNLLDMLHGWRLYFLVKSVIKSSSYFAAGGCQHCKLPVGRGGAVSICNHYVSSLHKALIICRRGIWAL